ncbi:FAD/NAD(P)-binding domain-containing protein [Metschnikowia bicuspidata var. bicuspidata NRRL YB-4993]|uniref:FAD/NAD(P)-binding domain-containing protein n=1 Tax=Metschnikowia bicuspidata var. bicuspidata NRRL YB-4993 TaxID=869754 RepID=A0A1A0HG28_9ASCO|nr:FAD/NAD(P)-binding domain-containing protein [Metschnikowia bicuspidata var. bicuspidata NRRL YB-4993]OBA22940.1 FAD/NAD(P)-binding domain-containing protein [Metschnikowia bicuspidata var. bicuspidata NRRL YB-4993]
MHYSVIIIGGGMAAGQSNTLILEVKDRLGGRLKSHNSTLKPGVCYDLGALWFHDSLRNPLLEKAKKLGNVEYFYDDGKHIYASEHYRSVPAWEYERVMADIETFGFHGGELISCQAQVSQQVLRMWLEMWDGILWEVASAKHFFSWGADHLGRNAHDKNGFETVFRNELAELPEAYQKQNIRLNTQVTHINYENNDYVTLTTSEGSVYTSDYVVVTAPLSVLRITDQNDRHILNWAPSLPQRFQNFLPECHYGSLGKVVLEFEKCFWPTDVHRFYILASEMSSLDIVRPWQNPTLIINYFAIAKVPSLVFLTQEPVSTQVERWSGKQIWQLFEPVVKQIATGPISEPFEILKSDWNNDPWTQGSYTAGRINTRLADEGCLRFAGAETIGGSSNGCAHGAFLSGEREARFILLQEKVLSKI